jgi:hypothetical protein
MLYSLQSNTLVCFIVEEEGVNMQRRNESPEDLLTAAEAAVILSKNSKKEIKPAYLNQLVRYGKIQPHKLDARTNLYRRGDVEKIVVESRGGKIRQNHSREKRQSTQKVVEPAA